MLASSRLAATALALASSMVARPAAAESECSPMPIEVEFLYPAGEEGTTDTSGVPADTIPVVGFSKEQCDGPLVPADAVTFTLLELSVEGGVERGTPVPATIAPLADDDVLRRSTQHAFTVTPDVPLTPGSAYRLTAAGEDLASDFFGVSFVVTGEATRHVEPPTLTVEVFDAGDGFTDLDVSFERPPQAHGVVLLQLTTTGGRPLGHATLPRDGAGPTRQSFDGLPDDADGGCLRPLLRAPDGVVNEGDPACFTLDDGGGCSASARRAPGAGVVVAAVLALALARRRAPRPRCRGRGRGRGRGVTS